MVGTMHAEKDGEKRDIHLEKDFFIFFVGFSLDLFSQSEDWLELWVMLLLLLALER
jgi:hypothetical protein